MIPVEDAAGGAAPGFHQQPEGTPDQHTDQIAYIEADADHKQTCLVDDAERETDDDFEFPRDCELASG